MPHSLRAFAGAVALAVLVAGAATAHAQDTATSDSETVPTMSGDMAGKGMMGGGYCMPGCVVAPMGGQGMMMGPGMMNQGQMPMMGYGMMGPGMMNQGQMPMMGYGMMGPGMMNQGMMNQMPMTGGMMGQGMMNQGNANLVHELTDEDVRRVLEHRLAMTGLPNLVVGTVEEQDADTILAEIVTKDGATVQRLSVDRHTGAMTPHE